MSNKDLFKEAIADAKAVREAALANAKVALEEALAPRLQNMISAKLQEMDEDLDEAEEKKELDEMEFSKAGDEDFGRKFARERHASLEESEDDLEEDFDLSEILAELEAEEEELKEAKKKKEDLDEAEEGEEEEEDDEEEEEEEEEGEEEIDMEEPEMEDAPEETSGEKLTDLTVDELKDIIKDIISAEMGGADMGGGDEMNMDMGDMGGEEGGAEIAVDEEYGMEEEGYDEDMEEELNLEELLAELDALGEDDDINEIKRRDKDSKSSKKPAPKPAKDDMKEAIATINTLRSELNEVNLLNAKLLYVNKIFKSKNLNESQKLKVIAQFDKATTAREAKTIYESMSTAIAATSTKKSSLKESIGFASKAAGVAPKKNIVEVDETMSRWQMLAGIRKF
jgi:hypothetical protein